MCISSHLPSRLECQQRGLNWNTPFILDSLIGYHRPGDMLSKVLSWFCLERDRGRPSARVTGIRERSNIASIRKTEIVFKVSAGAAFETPEALICLACQVSSSRPCRGWDLVSGPRLLKPQYFGHLMQRANSLEKTLVLGKIEGRRRRGRQRMRWLDGITDLMDLSLSKLREIAKTGKPAVLQLTGSQVDTT